MRAVEPEHEESRAEQVPVEREPFVVELRELVRLAADEQDSQRGRGEEPDLKSSPVSSLDCRQRQDHAH
jgi:hypothetical protein